MTFPTDGMPYRLSFTDDDLKRLKEYAKECQSRFENTCVLGRDKTLALLARMEAAETILNKSGIAWPIELDDEFRAWKKSKGEAG